MEIPVGALLCVLLFAFVAGVPVGRWLERFHGRRSRSMCIALGVGIGRKQGLSLAGKARTLSAEEAAADQWNRRHCPRDPDNPE